MNLELKSILQSLDGHIAAVQVVRDLLAKVMTGEVAAPPGNEGKVVFANPNALIQSPGVRAGGRETTTMREPRRYKKRKANTDGAHGVTRPTIAGVSTPAGAVTVGGKKPSTVAGVMKLEIAGLNGKAFTTESLRAALEAKYGMEEFWKSMSPSGISGNLSYWLNKGRLEKTGDGYRATEKDFFAVVEF